MVAKPIDLSNVRDQHRFWWHPQYKDERHERVSQLIERIYREQSYVQTANLDHMRAYTKRDHYMREGTTDIVLAGPSAYIGINATRSAIDTIVAKVTQQNPRPHFKTEGGSWGQRNRARKLQKFIDGLFYKTDFYQKLRQVFRDASVFGTGFMKPYWNGKDICWERVYPGNVVVDEASAVNGSTRSMFQVDCVPVESLIARFPEFEKDILNSGLTMQSSNQGVVTALVKVYEAWHLRDVDGRNGVHTVCTDKVTLVDEDYKYDHEPLFALKWNRPLVGYYGQGAVEDVAPLQEELDYIMGRIQVATHNGANVWLMKPAGCEVPDTDLTTKMCSIIEYDGAEPPQFYQSRIMDQQVFDHARWINELIYNVTGVSAMSATSQKPKGIESGKALQTMLDVESQRFSEVQKLYEDGVVTCTQVSLDLAKHHFVGGKSDYEVRVDNGKYTETIKWSDVSMNDDEYVLKVWPTNMLPQSPSGRMEWVERMMQTGLIDALTGMMLLDFPDVEAHQSLAFAAVRNALWTVDRVLYDGEKVVPREWHDLQRHIKFMQMGLSNAEIEGAPDSVLQKGMDYIADCEELLTPPEPPPTMEAGPAPGAMPPDGMGDMGTAPDSAAAMPSPDQIPGLPGAMPLPGM